MGYGDVFPVTVMGKVLGAVIAVMGIGMVALPTGIIGSGFMEQLQATKGRGVICPHCGKQIEAGP